MKLFGEIKKLFGRAGGEFFRIEYTVLDGGGGYFENVKRILEFSPEAIVLGGKKGSLRVEGQNLSLGKYFGGDLMIRGEIAKVERIS